MGEQNTSAIVINTESMLRGGELIGIKRAPSLLLRSPFSSNIRWNEMREGTCAVREKHRGRRKEGRKEGKDIKQEEKKD